MPIADYFNEHAIALDIHSVYGTQILEISTSRYHTLHQYTIHTLHIKRQFPLINKIMFYHLETLDVFKPLPECN